MSRYQKLEAPLNQSMEDIQLIERALKDKFSQELPALDVKGQRWGHAKVDLDLMRAWERVKGHSMFLKQMPLCLLWDEEDVNRTLHDISDYGYDTEAFHDVYNEEEKREFINDFFMRNEEMIMTIINERLRDAIQSELREIMDQEAEEE